jgi:hypothetical protein
MNILSYQIDKICSPTGIIIATLWMQHKCFNLWVHSRLGLRGMGGRLVSIACLRPTGHLSCRTQVSALFCLLVLLGHFLLPLAHSYQLSIAHLSVHLGPKGETSPNFCTPEIPSQPFHDPTKCPVCQETQNSQDFVGATPAFGTVPLGLIQPFSTDGSWQKAICAHHLISDQRAPPTSIQS